MSPLLLAESRGRKRREQRRPRVLHSPFHFILFFVVVKMKMSHVLRMFGEPRLSGGRQVAVAHFFLSVPHVTMCVLPPASRSINSTKRQRRSRRKMASLVCVSHHQTAYFYVCVPLSLSGTESRGVSLVNIVIVFSHQSTHKC